MERYKIIEDRRELSQEEIVAGMNFAAMMSVTGTVPNKSFSKSWVLTAIGIVAISAFLLVYKKLSTAAPAEKQSKEKAAPTPMDTNTKWVSISEENALVNVPESTITATKARTMTLTTAYVEENATETVSISAIEEKTILLPFERQINADSKYAVEIPTTVYGPVNVSQGYGDALEYKDKNTKSYEESNSAWFKFTVLSDTLLTFHIVPQLKTDNFDFVLFKCIGEGCSGDNGQRKLLPVKKCLSWNTSQNCNTGLSQSPKDTLFEAVFANGEKQGQTYASGLRVKTGETYYLMVNTNMANHQDPAGFMIYFFNHLPKKKVNTYKK